VPYDSTAPAVAPDGLAEAVLLEPEVRVLQPGTEAVYAYKGHAAGYIGPPGRCPPFGAGRRCWLFARGRPVSGRGIARCHQLLFKKW
jgi:hypothetical protein